MWPRSPASATRSARCWPQVPTPARSRTTATTPSPSPRWPTTSRRCDLLLSLGASAGLVTSRYDGTALIAAAHLGHDGVVRQLIAAGAPLDHVNNLHWTALIEAVVLGDGGLRHQAVVRALLDAGADARLADRDGRTPLQLARGRGYTAMAQLLEGAGPK